MSKPRRAVIVGYEYYSKYVAKLMNEQTSNWRLRAFDGSPRGTLAAAWDLRRADALISFGGPAPSIALSEIARYRNIPVIIIWAGSDVLTAAGDPSGLEIVKRRGFVNITDGEWLVDELRLLGIEATYQPVTAVEPGKSTKPLPGSFRVLTYLPEPRREFYGASDVYAIARSLPGVSFSVVGAGLRDPEAPPNVTFLGYVDDMSDQIDASTVLLRLPQHDGKSMLVLEALSRGRHVIWNHEFPHVRAVRSADAALSMLRDMQAAHARGELRTNDDGRSFVLATFFRTGLAQQFEAILNTAVAERTARRRRAGRNVAISGLGLFCADIAEQLDVYAPSEWSSTLIKTDSRLEVLTSLVSLAKADLWYSIGEPTGDRWLRLLARVMRKPRVVHWVGSDVSILRNQPHVRASLKAPSVKHLTEVEWMGAELREFGIESQIVPLPPRQPARGAVPALPELFTIMLYVPKTKGAFYGRAQYERLMRRFRGEPVRFILVGGGNLKVPSGVDVRVLGWRHQLQDIYPETTVLVRGTLHDGLSLMVLEALSFGRHVLWSQEFPFTRHIRSYDDMERELFGLLAQHREGLLEPQFDAAATVRERYAIGKCIRDITRAWDGALNETAQGAFAEAT